MESKKKEQKTCYLYTRVSTAIQVEGYSLEAQEERLRNEAKLRGFKVIGFYPDEGHSGKNIKGRPKFQEMLENIQTAKEKPDYVFVFKLSRFNSGRIRITPFILRLASSLSASGRVISQLESH